MNRSVYRTASFGAPVLNIGGGKVGHWCILSAGRVGLKVIRILILSLPDKVTGDHKI